MKSIPSEYSSFLFIDVSCGCVRKGLCFRYMWSPSGSNPHIAFTLRNLIHLQGSKLPQSGSFDPHRIHIVIVVSNPLSLCSHYTGKWFRCRVDPMSLHQKVLMWTRPKTFSIFQDVFFCFVLFCFVFVLFFTIVMIVAALLLNLTYCWALEYVKSKRFHSKRWMPLIGENSDT